MLVQKRLLATEVKIWKILIAIMQLGESLPTVYQQKFCLPGPVSQLALVLQSWNCCYPCSWTFLSGLETVRKRESVVSPSGKWNMTYVNGKYAVEIQAYNYFFFFLTMALFLSYIFSVSTDSIPNVQFVEKICPNSTGERRVLVYGLWLQLGAWNGWEFF